MDFSNIFIECFSEIEDPRVERTKKHLLLDVIGIALFATIAGAQSFDEIEDFADLHEEWLSQYFILPNGIPSEDTFYRVISRLSPKPFEKAFLNWISAIRKLLPENIIPIDGKTIRGSHRRNSKLKALHIVSAWSCANQMSLGQIKVDDKSNEITAIPELLQQLALEGAIITIDAIACQKNIAKQIKESKAEFVLAVKGNQPELFTGIIEGFEHAHTHKSAHEHMVEVNDEIIADHGRIESRICRVLPNKYCGEVRHDWPEVNSIIQLEYNYETPTEKKQTERRYFISSLTPESAKEILKAIRCHWQIESTCHWTLDVTFQEDQSRIHDENAGLNMAWLRKVALSFLKKDLTKRKSIRRKQMRAWAEPEYILELFKN